VKNGSRGEAMNILYRKTIIFLVCIIGIQSFLFLSPGVTADPPLFKIDAKAAVLLDALSSQVIFEQNPHQKLAPASLAKLMTLYLAYDALQAGLVKADDEVLISKKAWETQGSKMFVEVGKRVELQKLLEGIASISGNDACVAVAEYLSGLEEVFVVKMNERAHSLGMTNSHFGNVSGLPAENQFTTASDIGILSYHYMKSHPEALAIHSIKKFTFSGITQHNRNGLLWLDEGVDGLKTGWIDNGAGFHLVATAQKEDQRLIAVVMGARDQRTRENEALKLLNYGFKNFSTVTVCNMDDPIETVNVWKGNANHVSLIAAEPGIVTVPAGEEQAIALIKKTPERISAPLRTGESVGELEITLQGKPLKKIALIAQNEVASANLIKRLFHTALLSCIVPPYWGWIVLVLLFLLMVFAGLMMKRGL
jgi:D-alanyl-D-alanine carboxypeptidase (penicillin-binding protein 5/6)